MCGIVAVLQRPSGRQPPDMREIVGGLERALEALSGGMGAEDLSLCAGYVEGAERLLGGRPGILGLLGDRAAEDTIERITAALDAKVKGAERALDARPGAEDLESTNAAIVRLKDAVWAVRRDRLGTARAVSDLAGPQAGGAAIEAFTAIQIALSAIDRLEVRGRDSAGLHVLVRGHGLDIDSPAVRDALAARSDPLFRSGAMCVAGGHLAFVYKAAAEIGELGDNTSALRRAVREDSFLRLALTAGEARVTVLAHTRWASVGLISEPNAHPLDGEEQGASGPYVAGALNGDVDNHADVKAGWGLSIPAEITTDAKVIPVLVARHLRDGAGADEAFRETVAALEGSVAIAVSTASAPGRLHCALRGSGQALYVGMAEDTFVLASEPYGLVEQARTYLRMDGEAPSPSGARGQIVVLHAQGAGTIEGVARIAYDGTPLPVRSEEIKETEITTRDIDRGQYPHYLLKEISEAPRSFQKTLRGRITDAGVSLGPETMPASLRAKLTSGDVKRILVIGQGTAAVAGRAVASALQSALAQSPIITEAMTATELSGFRLRDDLSDTLVVAVSQSGTTTDTNRTVELARSRGASVVSIVNRRQSDLTDRSDGVLYTSDGRDVEMAVPSTKAFYAQIAAGFLLASAIAEPLGLHCSPDLLAALRELPAAMEEVLGHRAHIAGIAQRHAPSRRYWAVVGNGPNRIAAEEVRIKLSELCYMSIACDATEDKKHIDLSAEPLILVCAAGLAGSTADDVAKEVAIYRAHRAAPIVVASRGDDRYSAALDVIAVPSVHPELDFVLSAMAGHLFGYEAALAIDAQARPLREARAALESIASVVYPDEMLGKLAPAMEPVARTFFNGLRAGTYDGHLEAGAAVRLAGLLRYASGVSPLSGYEIEYGKVATPGVLVEDLAGGLTAAIDQLTRPIDAIKHQAKTVTVGISRADEAFFSVPLVRELLATGSARDRLGYGSLRTLAALDPAIEGVTGFTRYRIEGDPAREGATIHVVDRGGIAVDIKSRTDQDPSLRGSKRRVAAEREVLVARGRRDGRTLVFVPEVKGASVTGLVLLHVDFRDRLAPEVMRRVLEGYRDRYAALRDLVTETEPALRDDLLGLHPVADLLIESVQHLADRWRSA